MNTQADIKTREQKRLARDATQIYLARQRYWRARKEVPKFEREKQVRAQRTYKEALQSSYVEQDDTPPISVPGVKEQGFLSNVIIGATGVAAVTAAVSFGRMKNEIVQAAGRIDSAVSGTAGTVVAVAHTLLDRVNTVIENFANTAKELLGSFWLVPTAILAHYIVGHFADVPLLPVVASVFLAKLFGEQYWSLIGKWFQYQPQSGESVCSIGALIVSAVCAVSVPSKSAAQVAGEVMKRMSVYQRSKEGFEFFFKDALKYAEKAVNAILSLFSDKEVNWIGTSERLVDVFSDKVTRFERLVRTESDKVELSALLDAVAVQQEALGLKMTVRDPQTLMRIERGLTKLSLLLQPYQGAITASRNYRPEPTFLCFYGGSGVGKTTLVTKMACAILLKSGLCKPDEALRNLWQKGSTEYWNGYVNQKCLIMDDCFQIKPVKGETDSEYMNVIRMIGNWAYALNFADLESKGKFYFDTPLVIGTTNCANIHAMADMVVTDPNAVVRRIRYPYRIEVTDSYRGEGAMLDYKRVESEFSKNLDAFDELGEHGDFSKAMDAYPWEAWTLVNHDFANPQAGGATRTVRSLIDEVVGRIVESREAHLDSVRNLNRFMRNLGRASEPALPVVVQSGLVMSHLDEAGCSIAVTAEVEAINRALRICEGVEQNDYSEGVENPWSGITDSVKDFIWEDRHQPSEFQSCSGSVGTSCEPISFDTELERLRLQRLGGFASSLKDKGLPARSYISWSAKSVSSLGRFVRAQIQSFAARIKQSFSDCLTADGLSRLALGALFYTTVVGLAYGMVQAVKYMVRAIVDEPRSAGRGSPQSNVKGSPGAPKKVYFKPKPVKVQSGSATNKTHVHIYNNTYKMVLEGGNEPIIIGQVQFIEMSIAMMPAHFVRQLQEKVDDDPRVGLQKLTLFQVFQNQRYSISVGEFLGIDRVEIQDTDLVFVRFPKGFVAAARKITQFFLTASQLNDAIKASAPVRLDVATLYDDWEVLSSSGRHAVYKNTLNANGFKFLPSLASQAYENSNVLEYQMPTTEGMCGAPLTISENRHYGGRCYLGMHVAGAPGWFSRVGYSNVVTFEQATEAIRELKGVRDNFVEDAEKRGFPVVDVELEEQSGLLEDSFLKGSFTLIGKAVKPVSMSPSTKLRLSPIGEEEPFGPNVLAPARLSPFRSEGVLISPMVVGLSGYATPLEYGAPRNMEAIVALATKPFREASIGDYRGVLTKEQAVKGIEGMKLKPIARGKSPGYPFVHESKNGKRDYFGADGEFVFDTPQCVALFERVDEVVEAAKEGVRLSHIFTDFLKDETRPKAKVLAGETRVISGAPLDLVIATRMYFGTFMASMFRHHTVSGMCPGINPYNEWYQLASRLCSKGGRVFDGDFKHFDKSEQPSIHYAILDFINHWYGGSEEDNAVRSVLWLELVHSRHLGGSGNVRDIVYQWNKSMPSGHPLTTPVNSLYSLITLTACYAEATGDYQNMWERVYIGTFGDDNITNVSDEVSEVFNQVTVARDMKKLFGLVYTAGSKTGELVPYTTLSSCTFLKRAFVRDSQGSGGWIAPLDPNSFLFSSYYYKNTRDPQSDMAHNLEEMLGELSLHSTEMWQQYHYIAFQILEKMGRVPRFISREGYRAMMRQRTDAWF